MAFVLGGSPIVSQSAAVRFLEQSTYGPTPELVTQVQQTGFDTFLQTQFAAPVSSYPTPLATDTNLTKVQNQFFLNGVNDADQLRQRIAFALNEIWVVGANKVSDPTGYTNYMQALTNDALGNYYDVMTDVTLTPAMGHWLDMVNNDKPGYWAARQRKLRARIDAAFHDGAQPAQRRRHAGAGWLREPDPHIYPR